MIGQEYIYHNGSENIVVWIVKDCGMVQGEHAAWHKVLAKPIGFNNCPTMVLDFATLTKRVKP